jgi:hypothetical protein
MGSRLGIASRDENRGERSWEKASLTHETEGRHREDLVETGEYFHYNAIWEGKNSNPG